MVEIGGLVKTERPQPPHLLHATKISDGARRIRGQSEESRVRRDHNSLRGARVAGQGRYPKRRILIMAGRVSLARCCLGYPPADAPALSYFLLAHFLLGSFVLAAHRVAASLGQHVVRL